MLAAYFSGGGGAKRGPVNSYVFRLFIIIFYASSYPRSPIPYALKNRTTLWQYAYAVHTQTHTLTRHRCEITAYRAPPTPDPDSALSPNGPTLPSVTRQSPVTRHPLARGVRSPSRARVYRLPFVRTRSTEARAAARAWRQPARLRLCSAPRARLGWRHKRLGWLIITPLGVGGVNKRTIYMFLPYLYIWGW